MPSQGPLHLVRKMLHWGFYFFIDPTFRLCRKLSIVSRISLSHQWRLLPRRPIRRPHELFRRDVLHRHSRFGCGLFWIGGLGLCRGLLWFFRDMPGDDPIVLLEDSLETSGKTGIHLSY